MSQAPSKDKRKEEKDNIFLDMLYNLAVQLPLIVITWIISKFDWD